MGPARDSTAKLLYEKDQEISALKLQLKAHAAQTALIQNRLLVTQSALDALQTTHDEELRAAQTTANRLRKRLNASYEHVKLCEEQKDDLRDAVSSFLQRVEEPRNIWPQSQLHISSLLEPLDPKLLMHRNQDVPAEYGDDLMSRASSMIETLVCERDLAREAYRSLYKDAKMQIAALEAELAHRDYELEKCLMHHVDRRNDQGKAPTRNHLKPFTPLDPETVKKVLQETSIRHKILELGNEKLEKRLREFRRNAETRANRQRPSDATNLDDSDLTVRMPDGGGSNKNGPSSGLITQVDREIKELGFKVQAFASERDRLLKLIAERGTSDSENPEVNSTELVSVEASVFPTERSELASAYEASLQREKALTDKNVRLLDMLRQSHSSDHSEIHRPVLEPKAAHVELLEAEEGEVSMELATPLLPTTFISPEKSHRSSAPGTPKRADHSSPLRRPFGSSLFAQAPSSPRIEQSLISVEGVGTPERDEPGQPDAEGHFDLDTADLERLVGELDSAGQQVAESEKAINDLADLIVDLERTNLKKSEI